MLIEKLSAGKQGLADCGPGDGAWSASASVFRASSAGHAAAVPTSGPAYVSPPVLLSRIVFVACLVLALAAGLLATPEAATAHAIAVTGADFARLMRAMAMLKAAMVIAVAAATLWRLGATVAAWRLSLYCAAGAMMVAGTGLIWGMVHIGAGALLLHGGLVAAIVLLWRDPALTARLADLVAARRSRAVPAPQTPVIRLVEAQ